MKLGSFGRCGSGGGGSRSAGRQQLLELHNFFFELVDTKSEFVEGEGFEEGLDASRGGEGDESEDGSAEEEQKKNEGELEHVVWARANLSILFRARQRRGGWEKSEKVQFEASKDGRDPIPTGGGSRGDILFAENGTDGIFVCGFAERWGDRVGWGVESGRGSTFERDEAGGAFGDLRDRRQEERGGDGDGRVCHGERPEEADRGDQGAEGAREAGSPGGDQAEQDFQGLTACPDGEIVGCAADERAVRRTRGRLNGTIWRVSRFARGCSSRVARGSCLDRSGPDPGRQDWRQQYIAI